MTVDVVEIGNDIPLYFLQRIQVETPLYGIDIRLVRISIHLDSLQSNIITLFHGIDIHSHGRLIDSDTPLQGIDILL